MGYLDYSGVVTLTEQIKAHSNADYEHSGAVATHNQSATAHPDIQQTLAAKANSADLPTKTSDLQNDSGFLTDADLPDYVLGYDEMSSVGIAEVGEAVTGTPNYTPSGSVSYSVGTVQTAFSVDLDYTIGAYALFINGFKTTASGSIPIVTGINGFNGTGVSFVIMEDE